MGATDRSLLLRREVIEIFESPIKVTEKPAADEKVDGRGRPKTNLWADEKRFQSKN